MGPVCWMHRRNRAAQTCQALDQHNTILVSANLVLFSGMQLDAAMARIVFTATCVMLMKRNGARRKKRGSSEPRIRPKGLQIEGSPQGFCHAIPKRGQFARNLDLTNIPRCTCQNRTHIQSAVCCRPNGAKGDCADNELGKTTPHCFDAQVPEDLPSFSSLLNVAYGLYRGT